MKFVLRTLMLATAILCFACISSGQGWNQNRKGIYSAGIGYAQGIFIPVYDYPGHGYYSYGISFNISGEYKAHRVLGLGWQTGISFFTHGYYYNKHDDYYYTNPATGIPIGFKLNVHILEAANAAIRNKLDVYAGFTVGGGPAFQREPYSDTYAFFFAGPQVGIRYWFDKKLGIFGEFGWGATAANFGISF